MVVTMTLPNRWLAPCLLAVILAASACQSPPRPAFTEPINISTAKASAVIYHDSGTYLRDVALVADEVIAWLEQRAAKARETERLAVVFDIDETVLSNYPHILEQDFGYIPRVWDAWVQEARAPAIEPMRAAVWRAHELGYAVIFITGRKDPGDRAATALNLARELMGDYERLLLRPAGDRRPAVEFKVELRGELAEEGFAIVASVGDQWSDLLGGYAERLFKVPNPFYEIP
jgi:predicted secreted acid phosphatase